MSPPSQPGINDRGFHFTNDSKSLWNSLKSKKRSNQVLVCAVQRKLILDDAFILIGCWLSFLLSNRVASTQTGQRKVVREVRKAFFTCQKIHQAKFRYSPIFFLQFSKHLKNSDKRSKGFGGLDYKIIVIRRAEGISEKNRRDQGTLGISLL